MRLVCLLLLVSFLMFAEPPASRSAVVSENFHGVVVNDPYRWLEDQESPETRAWVEAQMSYTQGVLKTAPLRAKLETRLKELVDSEVMSAPVVRGGRYFFTRRMPGQKQPIWYWREGAKGEDHVLLDANALGGDSTQSYALQDIAEDGKSIAYGLRQGGEDEVAIGFREVASGKDFGDLLPRARYLGLAIKADRSALYYGKFTPQGPRVYWHKMGAPLEQDQLVFGEGYGPTNIIGVGDTPDGKWLLLVVSFGSAGDHNEVWVKDLTSDGPIHPLIKDVKGRFQVQYADGLLYADTDLDAPNGRIIRIDPHHPEQANWKEIIPQGKWPIQSFTLAGKHIVVLTLENVVGKVRLYTPEGKLAREVPPPSLGNITAPTGTWDRDEAYYSFTTFGQPVTVYRYDIATGKQDVWFQSKAPVKPGSFEVKQVVYTSKDGTKVPMFLAYKKGLKLDGTNPTMLTGYGGFNLASLPGFSATSTVWMELGGVWALANLRGGNEFGEEWHKAGMLDKKQNVFDDFIAAGEYLIAQKYTSKAKLAISGGSNGGLLVGAAMTQRPDLFGAVVCSVPLLDMLRYQRFLVARFWVPEYGSAENKDQFPFIYKYSPYHHVERNTNYPPVMFVSGDSDTRVAPLHARKMAALMQNSGNKNPVLLRYDTKAGHSAGLPVDKQIEASLDTLSFLTMQLGIK